MSGRSSTATGAWAMATRHESLRNDSAQLLPNVLPSKELGLMLRGGRVAIPGTCLPLRKTRRTTSSSEGAAHGG
eukprot:9937128-Alexandrium_andersonii.AAC.1